MHLYTIMLDYSGGTYVTQTQATGEDAALRDWISKVRSDRIVDGVSEEIAAAFDADEADLVPLDGLTGVWCRSASGLQGLALVNVIKTVVG
jgi:hypothetical protein